MLPAGKKKKKQKEIVEEPSQGCCAERSEDQPKPRNVFRPVPLNPSFQPGMFR
jgi:hypothetical protein